MSSLNVEEVLQYVSSKYVTVNEGEIRETNPYLDKILKAVTDAMKDVDPLFKELFEAYLYGGSSYDGLKVGKPDEFDIDLKLHLPNILDVQILPSDKDGFVYVHLKDWDRFTKARDEYFKKEKLKSFVVDEYYLSHIKIKQWMQQIVSKAINSINAVGTFGMVTYKMSGPAVTLVIDKCMTIDLVAVFRIPGIKWPAYPVRPNKSTTYLDYLVVPKPPKDDNCAEDPARYWRLSFPEQEKQLMKGLNFCKPAIRFLKTLRDTRTMNIPSYFIKTVFLWEVESRNQKYWNGSLTKVFLEMLEIYKNRIAERNIPYFWSENNNFLESYSDENITAIKNYLENMIKDINRNKDTNPVIVAKHLLPEHEYYEVCVHFNVNSNTSDNFDDNMVPRNDSDNDTTSLSNKDVFEGLAVGVAGVALLGYSLYKFLSPSTSQGNRNN